MSDKAILDIDNLDDFELPPLPARPVKLTSELQNVAAAPVVDDSKLDVDLPPLPEKPIDDSVETINSAAADDLPEAKSSEQEADSVDEIELSDDFDLPPLRTPEEAKKEEPKPDDEVFIFEDDSDKEEAPPPAEDIFDFEGDYDMDLDNINTDNIVLEEMARVAPIRSSREESERNIKESIRMSDLEMDIAKPVLDDLSDEYAAPQKKAESLVERDKLEADEKLVLKQRLQEDLGKRPENFNARASKNMYNKLMEEKKLKIAKKGFAISFIPIIMGLIGAALCYLKMNWGAYQWFKYVAVFAVVGSLLLFIKSKHAKMFSIILYALTLIMYVGPGLVLYALNETMQAEPDYTIHIICAAVACVMNIAAVIILTKNEAVNTYYTTSFSRKR